MDFPDKHFVIFCTSKKRPSPRRAALAAPRRACPHAPVCPGPAANRLRPSAPAALAILPFFLVY